MKASNFIKTLVLSVMLVNTKALVILSATMNSENPCPKAAALLKTKTTTFHYHQMTKLIL